MARGSGGFETIPLMTEYMPANRVPSIWIGIEVVRDRPLTHPTPQDHKTVFNFMPGFYPDCYELQPDWYFKDQVMEEIRKKEDEEHMKMEEIQKKEHMKEKDLYKESEEYKTKYSEQIAKQAAEKRLSDSRQLEIKTRIEAKKSKHTKPIPVVPDDFAYISLEVYTRMLCFVA